MAQVLKLNWGTVNVDLLTGTALNVMTWTPSVATPTVGRQPEPLTESLTVKASGSSHDVLATNLQALHNMQRRATEYIEDRGQGTPVWIHAKLTNETGERRSLVRRIDTNFISPWYGPSADVNPTTMLSMAIEREPYWETTSESSESTLGTAISSVGGTAHYTGIVGDVAARLNTHLYSRKAPIGDDPSIDTVWLGIRSSDRHANLTTFMTAWECDKATLTNDTSATADTNASGGTTAQVTFATEASWADRVTKSHVYNADTAANVGDQEGRFLVLLRARMNSGTAEVRLKTGWNTGGVFQTQTPITISSTDYRYHEVGVVKVPPQRMDGSFNFNDFALRYNVRRTSASGSAYLDATVIIPIDEAFLKLEDGSMMLVAGDERPMYAIRQPDGVLDAHAYLGNNPIAVPPISEYNWYLPAGNGMFVVAAERSGSQVTTDEVALKLSHYQRWLSLRGNE